jgi:ATP-dependent helicase/DNAse subunit B
VGSSYGLVRGLDPKSIANNIKGVFRTVKAINDCKKILKEFQPDVIMGTGGFACFPALMAGSMMKIPTCVHESNALPGLTTRMLASRVDRTLICFPESAAQYKEPKKLIAVGMPIRQEFVRNRVTTDLLRQISPSNQVLSDKLHDVTLVLSAYDALVSNSFEDPDGELSIACDLLRENPFFEGFTICVDSYLSFTQLELDVLTELMLQCKDLYIALSDDGKIGDDSIFTVSRDTARRLRACATNNNIPVGTPVICDYKEYFQTPELLHIEENIFRSR